MLSLNSAGRCFAALVIEAAITQLGETRDLLSYAKQRGLGTIDLEGRTVVPGGIDTHFHLTITGMNLASIDFNPCRSVDEVLELLRENLPGEPGRWIVGKGLDEFELTEKRPPTAKELDAVCKSSPVFIEDRGYHYVLVNSLGFVAWGSPRIARGSQGPGRACDFRPAYGKGRRRRPACPALLMDEPERQEVYVRDAYAATCGITTLHAIEDPQAATVRSRCSTSYTTGCRWW